MLINPILRPFARKSVEQIQEEHEHGELKRTLGAISLIFFGIGTIIGTGIFVLTGRAAAQFAGPGIMVSFVITGTLCALVALCYAELASTIPVSGSAYSYSYASLGEFAAWVMGVLLLLEYGLAASTVAVGWSGYVVSFLHDFNINIPAAWTAAPGVQVKDLVTGAMVAGQVNLPAILGIAAVTMLLIVGVTESATVNSIVVVIKVSVVIAFIVIGWKYVNTDLWHPLVPPQACAPNVTCTLLPPDASFWDQIKQAIVDVLTGKNTTRYGIGGLITGAATIFFAYIGFEAVSTAGAESKNPARDMPIGILGSLAICTVLYILTSAVLVGIVPYKDLDNPAPIAMAVNQIGLPWFAKLVKIGAIAGLSSVMLILVYGQTRIFYTMSRDGLLPGIFAVVNKRTKTPWMNTIFVGLIAAGSAGFFGLDTLSNVTNVGTLLAFAIVCFTVIYLRMTKPNLPRPFRTPLFPFVPILGIIGCLFLLASLIFSNEETKNFFLWYVGIGLVVYFLYGIWNTKLGRGVKVTGHEAEPQELPHRID